MSPLLVVGVPAWMIVKISVLIFLFIYIIFAIIVTRQINLMSETLDVEFDEIIKVIGMFHLIISVAIFLLSLFIL